MFGTIYDMLSGIFEEAVNEINLTVWLKDHQNLQTLLKDSEFDQFLQIFEQVKNPGDSGPFNCDHYESYLRCLQGIAMKIDRKEIARHIEFLYLLPFDLPNTNLKTEGEEEKIKKEWSRTLFYLAHKKDDPYFGRRVKERAEEEFFVPELYLYKCHGQK